MKLKSILPKLALFSAALIWGSSFFIVKETTDAIPPNMLIAIRFSVACPLLAIVFFKKLKQLNKGYFLSGAVIGFLLFCAYSTQTIGITDTTPGKNAFLTAVYCVIVPFLFWIFGKTKPDIYNIIAAVMCIAGIGLVSLTDGFTVAMGDGLTLLGGFFYAAHIVAFAMVAKNRDAVLLTILQFGFAAVFSWITSFVFEDMPSSIPTSALYGIAFLAVFCTAVALLFQSIGQKYTNPSAASVILSLESVFGVAFSVAFGYEELTFRLVVGFAVIFIAVLVSETKLSFLRKKR